LFGTNTHLRERFYIQRQSIRQLSGLSLRESNERSFFRPLFF
jgi:hypothetical protein